MRGWARAAVIAALGWTGCARAQADVDGRDFEMFPRGLWTVQGYGSGTADLLGADSGNVLLGHVGVGYYVLNNVSLNLEGALGVTQARSRIKEESLAYGLDLLLRWHILNFEDPGVSVYLEGGAGLLWTENPFPPGGTHQNFSPQGGLGVAWRLSDHLNLLSGARWHHISNASKGEPGTNPGYDGILGYVGLQWGF